MVEHKATNITWHEGVVSKSDREKLLNQKGVTIWFTGLSASGKSTLAREVERLLYHQNHLVYVLDGDNIRHGLNKNLGFSPADREENIRRIGEVAKLFSDAGVIVLTAFISPYKADRDKVRALLNPGEFIEVHLDCPIDVCERRDPKGLFKKARAGEIKDFTGISTPYEAPDHPEIYLNTAQQSLVECATIIIDYLKTQEIISDTYENPYTKEDEEMISNRLADLGYV